MTESVSQQITRLLGTADWVILHSGTTLVDDETLDDIEVQSDMQAPIDGDTPRDRDPEVPVTWEEIQSAIKALHGQRPPIGIPNPHGTGEVPVAWEVIRRSNDDRIKTVTSRPLRSGHVDTNDAINARVASIVAEARSACTSDDPLVHIAWAIYGLDFWHRSNGSVGNSPDLTVEIVTSQVLRIIGNQPERRKS